MPVCTFLCQVIDFFIRANANNDRQHFILGAAQLVNNAQPCRTELNFQQARKAGAAAISKKKIDTFADEIIICKDRQT